MKLCALYSWLARRPVLILLHWEKIFIKVSAESWLIAKRVITTNKQGNVLIALKFGPQNSSIL